MPMEPHMKPAEAALKAQDLAGITMPEISKLVHVGAVTGPEGIGRGALYSDVTIAEAGAVQAIKAWQASCGVTFGMTEIMGAIRPSFLHPLSDGPQGNPMAVWFNFLFNLKPTTRRTETGPSTGYWHAPFPDFWKVEVNLLAYAAYHRVMCGLRFDAPYYVESLMTRDDETQGPGAELLGVLARPRPKGAGVLSGMDGTSINPAGIPGARTELRKARDAGIPFRVYADNIEPLEE